MAGRKKPYQVKREDLTDEQYEHLTTNLFPLLVAAEIKARARLEARERASQ